MAGRETRSLAAAVSAGGFAAAAMSARLARAHGLYALPDAGLVGIVP